MSLQMMIGGEGSSRQEMVYKKLLEEALMEPEQTFYLIVPEQYTMQTQMKMTELHPGHGVMNIDIVSFPRLAYRVFDEIGGIQKTILEDTGKSMVIRRLLSENREVFEAFAGSVNKHGFVEQAKSMLSELFQYNVKSEDLTQSCQMVGEQTILGKKLKDIQTLYDAFKNYMSDQYMTAEELLTVLAERIGNSKGLKGSVIYIENFTGFTPSQYRLLEELLRLCKKVVIGLSIDLDDKPYELGQEYQLFYLTKETLWKLKKMCTRLGIEQEEDILCESSNSKNELDFLEKHLFRFHHVHPWEENVNKIQIFSMSYPSEEVRFAATKIRQMVMECGYSYKDFAIITGDVGRYEETANQQFSKMDIPLFIDSKENFSQNSFVCMLRSAMDVILKDFAYESVFTYLRAGYSSLNIEEIDVLDNYILATGIRGLNQWSKNFIKRYRDYGTEDYVRLNEARENIVKELEPLFLMRRQGTVHEYTEALRQFIDEIHGEEKLAAYVEWMNEKEDFVHARAYSQVYEAVVGLLDKFEQILGETKINLKDYVDILEAGAQEIEVGVIPPTLDQVVLGDLKRTRLDDVKVVFLLGCNDGVIPTPVIEGGLITDREKEQLSVCPLELAPTGKQNSFREKFYIYTAMSKPREQLILTYAQMDVDGKAMRPSTLIKDVRSLFTKLEIRVPEKWETGRVLSSLSESKAYLLEGMRHPEHRDALWQSLFAWFSSNETLKRELESWMDIMFNRANKHPLSRRLVENLYGLCPIASITTLEKYASCAYAHFLSAGLKLEERKTAKLLPPDMGNILHEAMERFSKIVENSDYSWQNMPDHFREETIEQCVREAGMEYGSAVMLESPRHHFYLERLVKMAKRTVWTIQKQICKGYFVPKGFETKFSIGDDVRLVGTVDRYDIYDNGDTCAVRIIDYKSGTKEFDLTEIYYGLSLQLVVYLESITQIEGNKNPDKQMIKAGMFYYHMQDPILEEEFKDEKERENKLISQLKLEGIANSDEKVIEWMDASLGIEPQILPLKINRYGRFSANSSVASSEQLDDLGYFVHRRIQQLVDEWMSGDISKNPYLYIKGSKRRTACDYCKYQSICRFDEKLEDCKYHRLKELSAEDVWKKVYEEVKETWENHGQKNNSKPSN